MTGKSATRGFVHIYFGDGKGKTTAGMGLAVRAAGAGLRVLIYQFMKNNRTSEREILKTVPNITVVDGPEQVKFSFRMTPEEKTARRELYDSCFQTLTKQAADEDYDVLFLDEAIYAVRAGLLDEKLILEFLSDKPDRLEVILTGNTPGEELLAAADYVSEIRKRKHPYDQGVGARKGIEL